MLNVVVVPWTSGVDKKAFEEKLISFKEKEDVSLTFISPTVEKLNDSKQLIATSDAVVILYHAPNNEPQDSNPKDDEWHRHIVSAVKDAFSQNLNLKLFIFVQNSGAIMKTVRAHDDATYFRMLEFQDGVSSDEVKIKGKFTPDDRLGFVMDIDASVDRMDGVSGLFERTISRLGFDYPYTDLQGFYSQCRALLRAKAALSTETSRDGKFHCVR